jgi:hypothetical protein
MMKLDYAGGEVLVSDALCHALLNYSADIARTGGSENLRIPVLTADGARQFAEVVIGPASQLLATTIDTADVDLQDSVVIAEILGRSASLQPRRVVPMARDEMMPDFEDQL